jgi:hypothetical protein
MSGRAVLHRAGAIRPTGRGGGAPHAPGRGEAARSSTTDTVDTVVGGAFTGRAACEASALLRRAGSAGAGAVVSGGTISVGTASRRLASRCRGTGETTRALSGRARCACARAAAGTRRRHLGISLRVHGARCRTATRPRVGDTDSCCRRTGVAPRTRVPRVLPGSARIAGLGLGTAAPLLSIRAFAGAASGGAAGVKAGLRGRNAAGSTIASAGGLIAQPGTTG